MAIGNGINGLYSVALVNTFDNPGNTLPNYDVSIRDGFTEDLVEIYSDAAGTNPIAQPGAKTDSRGVFSFYAANGYYIARSNTGGSDFDTPVGSSAYDADYAGFDAALFSEAGITANGEPDTAVASQRLDALKSEFQDHSKEINRNPGDGSAHNSDDVNYDGVNTLDNLKDTDSQAIVGGKKVAALGEINSLTSTHVVDMHYGALLGCGFTSGESGGVRSLNVTVAASAGDKTITVTNTTDFIADQLISIRSSDGTFIPAIIKSTAGGFLTLRDKLTKNVDTGINVYNFYNDQYHPNEYGFNAIADYAINTANQSQSFNKEIKGSALGAAVITLGGANNNFNPGSVSIPVNTVTPTASTADGISFGFGNYLKASRYVARLKINAINKTLRVRLQRFGGGVDVYNELYDNETAGLIEIPFTVHDSGTYQLDVTNEDGTATAFIASQLVLTEAESAQPNVNNGTHVMLGDSWYVNASAALPSRLEDTLPGATIVNKGVGGNTAAQLLARFDTDVTPENPNYVWIMCGTNDYASSVTLANFSSNLNKLKTKCREIGAQPIVFTSSVGSPSIDPDDFDLSRNYSNKAYYFDNFGVEKPKTKVLDTLSISPTVVATGESLIFGHRGRVNGDIGVHERYFRVQPDALGDQAIELVEAADIFQVPPASTVLATLDTGLVTSNVDVTTSSSKFVFFVYTNTTGVDQTIEGYAHVTKTQDVASILE